MVTSRSSWGGVPTPASVRAQALTRLARREHSRQELRRKLMQWVLAQVSQPLGLRGVDAADAPDADALRHLVEGVLDELAEAGHLSDARFAESRVHARQARFGNRRITGELREHGLALADEQRLALRDSELARARRVLAARFGEPLSEPPPDPSECRRTDAAQEDPDLAETLESEVTAHDAARRLRTRMQRFLLTRGFSPETVRDALRDRDAGIGTSVEDDAPV